MNSQMLSSVTRLSDDALISRVKQLAAQEREATVALIAHLAELDARRLYLAEGCSSLFTYCTQVLHLSEHAACPNEQRIHSRVRTSSPSS